MTARAPLLSLVVVVYDMPEQARRTLHSLATPYQRNVVPEDYEVVVVENASRRLLGRDAALSTGPNVRYFLREDDSRSPLRALNFGGSESRGESLAVLIDGARLVTPGAVELSLMAQRAARRGVLSVPGYHLGSELQQKAALSGYDEAAEASLLSGIAWPEDGYRLFDVACFSGSCAGGFFLPFAESNFLSLPRELWRELGGYDERFVAVGGGYSNLDFYTRVCAAPDVTLFVAPGEGTFHQLHGGITTGGTSGEERARLMEGFVAEYRTLRGRDFEMPAREPLYLGRIGEHARRFVLDSAQKWVARTAQPPRG